MSNPEKTRMILADHQLAPSKKLGQNFLKHSATAAAIVESAGFLEQDVVVEVGVGLGALTVPLAHAVKKVYGIEFDSGIIRYHQSQKVLPGNVELIHADILRFDLADIHSRLGRPLKIIANLPYSISNPFIFKIIEDRSVIDQVVVMLQKEVADRLCASSGTKEYGIPSVLLGSCATIERLLTLRPEEFHPRPKIDSEVIRIRFRNTPEKSYRFATFQKIVRAAFASRRKTLINNLLAASPLDAAGRPISMTRERLNRLLATLDIDPAVRGEALSISTFERLTEAVEAMPD